MLTATAVPPLTAAQQTAYLTRIARGASLAAACASLGLSVTAVLITLETDATFRAQQQQIDQLLSQNVAAALYQAAMKGNVPAQTFLLKNRPPSGWQGNDDENQSSDDLERLTDDQLAALLRQTEDDHPSETAS